MVQIHFPPGSLPGSPRAAQPRTLAPGRCPANEGQGVSVSKTTVDASPGGGRMFVTNADNDTPSPSQNLSSDRASQMRSIQGTKAPCDPVSHLGDMHGHCGQVREQAQQQGAARLEGPGVVGAPVQCEGQGFNNLCFVW
jgi:hypothetical protein